MANRTDRRGRGPERQFTAYIRIDCTEEMRERWAARAASEGLPMATWARGALEDAEKRSKKTRSPH